MDSCVTAAIARQTHEVALVHVSYGQRTERRERQAFDDMRDILYRKERAGRRISITSRRSAVAR